MHLTLHFSCAKYHKTPADSDVLVNTEPQFAPRRNAGEKTLHKYSVLLKATRLNH